MARHSFIQMSKLPNVKGRISYITSHARQENLYATYRTADNAFWNNLARESRQEFQRSGAEGKCIEARELIIALPEVYTQYEPQQVLEDFTDEFRRRYGVECVSALHHNKRKTNYHIHLIFSERKLLPEPDVKIATRSVFFDETGKRVRTKKEITGEDGQIRKGCTIIKKGEVYESHLFTVKDDRFKREPFLREVKEDYTNLIKSTRHFPACSHNFPKAGEARFQGRSRLFRLLGKLPYLGESRRILMAVSSKTSSKTRFCYAATRRISSAAVQPSIWA